MRTHNTPISVVTLLATTFACLGATAQSGTDKPGAANYLYPAKGVDKAALKSDDRVVVKEAADHWYFGPARDARPAALLYFPGGGVEPTAYAPLLRAVAANGTRVYLVKLPGQPALPARHKQDAIAKGKAVIKGQPDVKRWVVGGHSMGGAVAAQFVHEAPKQFRGLILIGTTHPRDFDLSGFAGDVTKVYGTEDNVARAAQSDANRKLLPKGTTWVRVAGGNHAQFGYYGAQFRDGKATISREKQHQVTAAALVQAMQRVAALRE
jgi:pimeloyl-ACP methyl ester carboxylesterase